MMPVYHFLEFRYFGFVFVSYFGFSASDFFLLSWVECQPYLLRSKRQNLDGIITLPEVLCDLQSQRFADEAAGVLAIDGDGSSLFGSDILCLQNNPNLVGLIGSKS